MTPIVYAAATAWLLSQITKVIVGFARLGRSDVTRVPWRLVWAGGMPSSHSAFVTAALITVAWRDGFSDSAFGLAFVLAAVVIYDRNKLFHMYGVFQDRFPELAAKVREDPVLQDLVGHRTSEIAVGIAIGLLSAFLIGWAFP